MLTLAGKPLAVPILQGGMGVGVSLGGLAGAVAACGGMGCISVLSNVVPAGTVAITDKFFAGDVAGAAQLQCKYMPLIRSLFCESNPIPVKAAMAAMGYCENFLRLPLVPMEEDHYETMIQRMRALGINV